MHDLIIRGGSVYDGSGGKAKTADIAIKSDRIAEVGSVSGQAKRTIDAEGAIVAPAWIDIHTHYDGQVTWDDAMEPSASHGVGTVVMGNCGVGFAPVVPGGEKELIELMEGVEDIPGTALYEGIPWGEWESFAQYLDFLDRKRYAINTSAMIAHGPVRNYVMGSRGRSNDATTESDLEAMGKLVEEALRSGAVGFSTSRILGHRSMQGEPVPGTFANDVEVLRLAQSLRDAQRGVFQIIPASTLGSGEEIAQEHSSLEDEIELMAQISRGSGRPLTFTLFQVDEWSQKWREVIKEVKNANQDGAQVFPQVGSRPTGLVLGIDTYHPWQLKPTYKRELLHLPLEERLASMRDSAVKQRLLSEEVDPSGALPGSMDFGLAHLEINYQLLFPLQGVGDFEPFPEQSVSSLALSNGEPPASTLYDYLVADSERRVVLFFTNYTDFNLDAVYEMQLDSSTVVGLSDAGAHVSLIFDAVNPTYQLTHWTRDRTRGPRLPLELVIHKATHRNAQLFGFSDKGLIAAGMSADINVIDYKNLGLGPLELRADLPGGGRRYHQSASGYVATLINGEITRWYDQDTGVRSGRLIRSC